MYCQPRRTQWNKIPCLSSANKELLSCCVLFFKWYPSYENMRASPLLHKDGSGKWLGVTFVACEAKKTIPSPIKVFKSAVLPAAQLRSNCFTVLQAVQDIYWDGTYWPNTWYSWRITWEEKCPCNPGSFTSSFLQPKNPTLATFIAQADTYGQWQMYVETDVCAPPTALLSGHGC